MISSIDYNTDESESKQVQIHPPLHSLKFADAPDVLNVQEAAHLLRLHPTSLSELCRIQREQTAIGKQVTNPIPCASITGKKLLFPKSSLLAWIEREAVK